MKTLFLCLFTIYSFSQNNQDYEKTLNGLNLSYVKFSDELELSELLALFDKSHNEYIYDSIKYQNSLKMFFDSDIGIVDYLLTFEHSFGICNWVETNNPKSSNNKFTIAKSNSAIVLINNYLTPNKIEISYQKDKIVSYRKIKRFLKKNNDLNLEYLRLKYMKKFTDFQW